MRRLAAAVSLFSLFGTAVAEPVVEGVNPGLSGRILGSGASVVVMVLDAPQQAGGDFSAFQSFAEFDTQESSLVLTAIGPAAERAALPIATPVAVLGQRADFGVPSAEAGRFGLALDPTDLVTGDPETLGPDVGLLSLDTEQAGSLPPIAAREAAKAQDTIPNPLPGAVWLLGSALAGLGLARRRRV